jgi:predicted transcriptional regulator YheO
VSPILSNLRTLAHAIAAIFGDICEVVIHDLSDRSNLDHTIVALAGNITQREVGGPPTDVLLRKLRSHDQLSDFTIYESTTRDGKILKSSTAFIRDERGTIIGAFCVNLDVTRLVNAKAILETLCSTQSDGAKPDSPEVFASRVGETLDSIIDDAVRRSGKPIAHMDKDDKVELVRYVELRGGFLIRRAVDQVAKRLGVSRYTVYNYLNEVRAEAS